METHSRRISFCFRATALALSVLVLVAPTHAQQATPSSTETVTEYPKAFFAGSKTSSAFDMLVLLPGYTFVDSDVDVRGLAGASGNVLIDGSRPATKYESLETILRRIPASAVEHIDVIRSGTPGIDMQGHSALANVVRSTSAQARGSIEAGSAFYTRGFEAPHVAAELTHRNGDRLLELSGSAAKVVDDEHGAGSRPRVSAEGQTLRDGDYSQDEGERILALGGGFEDRVLGGRLRLHGSAQVLRFRADILDAVTFPTAGTTTVTEFDEETSGELGATFERTLPGSTQFELTAIHRSLRERGGERSSEADEWSLVRDDSDASESILRTLMRHSSGALTYEGGLELAMNTLDDRSSLIENDVNVPIPNADVRVEERRSEAFVSAIWALSPSWSAELGSRFEYSELTQSGNGQLRKTLLFPKPRALFTWSRGTDKVRLLIERNVGQLDFEDFASSVSLSTGTVTAGNPDLEPDQTWLAEASWERSLLGNGAFTVALRHEEIDDLVDRIPVIADETFDAIGNIGSGLRNEVEVDMTLPLDGVGLSSALLKVAALWRHSQTTDPVTRESRTISDDVPLEAAVHFSQAVPNWNGRWGVDLTLPTEEREYHFDEIRTDTLGAMLNVFVEFEPVRSWNIRLFVNNLTDRSAIREREVYEGMRSEAPMRYVETRTLDIGTYAGMQVRRRFGE